MKLILLTISVFIAGIGLSQNVGINTDGSAPSKLLHVKANSASDGVRIQNDAANGDPTLDFNVNGTSVITMGIDDSDADKFKIGTTAITASTRMTLTTAGFFGIGTTAPTSFLHVNASQWPEISWMDNSDVAGTGLMVTGQNGIYNGLVTGSGISAVGFNTAVYGYVDDPAGAVQGALYQDFWGAQWNVGHWTGAAYRKILGTGTVSTIVDDLDGEKVILNCPEGPENWFMDYGTGKLIDGVAHIEIDPILAKNIVVNEEHPLKVFIQLEGDCNGVYVTNKSANGFDVKELQGGDSNVSFSYSIVANRANETFTGPEGQIRVSDYSIRWEKAPAYQENLKNRENNK